MSIRTLKNRIRNLLSLPDQTEAHRLIFEMPLKKVVSPLFSFLYAGDGIIKWHAVTLLGRVVSEIANTNMEAARVVMRRLMWNLNDESGGIGWGSPEAMGEIMARNEALAREYHAILTSYIREDGNYIEYEMLQRGVLWGLGRLGRIRPDLLSHVPPLLIPFLTSEDPILRGLAVWTAAPLPDRSTAPYFKALSNDDTVIEIYLNEQLTERSIRSLVNDARFNLSG